MFKTLFPRNQFRFTVPALAVMVLAGGIAAAPAAAEPPRHHRSTAQSADVVVRVDSHREYRRDGSRQSGSRWQKQGHHRENAQRPHHRRHIVQRDWRRHYRGSYAKRHDWRRHNRGHYAKRYNWRRDYNRSRSDWGHRARRNIFR